MRVAAALGSVVLAVVSTTIGLLAVELWFRSRWGAPTPLYVADADVGWLHAPNLRLRKPVVGEPTDVVVETDARGRRPPFHPTPTGGARVLILGDSFADGMEVATDQHFATLLQARRPDLELVNAGVSGYSTLQELLLARRLAPEVRPVLRVVLVYGNDVHDNVTPFFPMLGPRPWVDRDGQERPPDWDIFAATLPPVPFSRFLHWHSMAYFRWSVARMQAQEDASRRYLTRWMDRFSMKERWAVTERLLGELAREGPLLVVSCPGRDEMEHDDRALPAVLTDIGGRLGVPVLDLQPRLRPADYWQRNIHWNADGHRTVAAVLADALDGLVPRRPL